MAKGKKFVERLADMPWRKYLVVLYTSFALASTTSVLIGHFLFPIDPDAKETANQAAVGNDAGVIPKPLASLSDKDVAAILERNVFNSDKEKEEAEDNKGPPLESIANTNEIPESKLPVKLHGTIYGGDPFSGIAMVENTQQRKVNSVMVGETLVEDAIVSEILRERIIIDRGGTKEYIAVQQPEKKDRRSKRSKKPAAKTTNVIAPIAVEPPPDQYKEEGFEREKGRIDMTEAYRDKLLTQDFAKVLQDAKATPNMVDGQLKGFKLTRIRQDSIYEKAGLQNDDVIEEINGVPLTDTAQAIRLLQSLRQEREIEVRLLRGGSYQSVTLNIR